MAIEEALNIDRVVNKRNCVRDGFLPVPICSVPPESLSGLEVFIYTAPTYNLYKSSGLDFGDKDYQRLIDAGTKYVYIETKNHQRYYNAIEDTLSDIVNDKTVALEKKCEILYATTLALTQELTSNLPETETINKVEKLTRSTIDLILKNPSSFNHLFNMSNHDFYTATHTSNVSIMLLAYAGKLGIKDTKVLNDIGTGGLLHDVGKIFVPQHLLNSTDKLSEHEFELIRDHVEKGVEHLRSVSDLSDTVLKLVAEHHEKLDGKGYPKGLAGDEISVYGRMITIVDMFEAMTSVRPYRSTAIPVDQAMEIILDMAPEQLDIKIVNSFNNFLETNLSDTIIKTNHDDSGILEAFGIECPASEPTSGRRHQRYFFRVRSTLKTITKLNGKVELGQEHSIIVHNISQSGLGILSNRKYNINQYICIDISIPSQNRELKYIAEIVRIIDHGDGWHTIGAAFIKEQTTEHIKEVFNSLK